MSIITGLLAFLAPWPAAKPPSADQDNNALRQLRNDLRFREVEAAELREALLAVTAERNHCRYLLEARDGVQLQTE